MHVPELAVTSHMLLRGQDTQELPPLHGGFETFPRFLHVGLPNIWDFFFVVFLMWTWAPTSEVPAPQCFSTEPVTETTGYGNGRVCQLGFG